MHNTGNSTVSFHVLLERECVKPVSPLGRSLLTGRGSDPSSWKHLGQGQNEGEMLETFASEHEN